MKENIKIEVNGNAGELVIREGAALPQHEPTSVTLCGEIEAPVRFLSARKVLMTKEAQLASHVVASRGKREIRLTVDESSFFKKTVKGVLEASKESGELPINKSESISCLALSDLIKMRRYLFASPDAAMKLVADLRGLKARIEGNVEKSKDDRGNYAIMRRQVVESNIPASFAVCMPLFAGFLKVTVQVEIAVDADTLECRLVSPHMVEAVRDAADEIMCKQVEAIAKLCPDILVIWE
jgi:hypothetical protein